MLPGIQVRIYGHARTHARARTQTRTHTHAQAHAHLNELNIIAPSIFSPSDSARTDQLNMFAKTAPSKKRRKSRTAFTNQQIYELEKRFLYQKYLTPTDRDEIALSLGLTNAQVITWFQNRRAKLKRDLEELKADVTAAKKTSECGSEMDEEMPYVPVSSSPDEMRSREAAELDALKALSPKTPVTSSIRLDTTATSANS